MPCKVCGGSGGGESSVALPLTTPPSSSTCPQCSQCSQPSASCGCEAFCEEDHTACTVYKKYGFTVRISTSFVWPATGQNVTFTTSGVDRLSPGSILWNPTAGYLHVVSFEFASQTIVAKNEGEQCNGYTGGETLPECTDFVVGPPTCPPAPVPDPNTPYLDADFISPADTECAIASVTNITGLTVNDIVSVFGYEYRVGEIIDTGTIRLCNDGNGAPEGTVIEWDADNDQIPNVPILVTASENPCTREPISAGVLLACDGADVARPLVGSADGQIAVWDNTLQRFELKNISAEVITCTSLAADFTVDPLHVGSYLITVFTTAGFSPTDIVVIANVFYTVMSVDNATQMHIAPFIPPPIVVVYPTGTPVCLFLTIGAEAVAAASGTSEADAADTESVETPPANLVAINNSTVRTMYIMVSWIGYWKITTPPTADFPSGQIVFSLAHSLNGAPYVDLLPFTMVNDVLPALAGGSIYSDSINHVTIHNLSPGQTLTLGGKAILTGNNLGAPNLFVTAELSMQMKLLGVAL